MPQGSTLLPLLMRIMRTMPKNEATIEEIAGRLRNADVDMILNNYDSLEEAIQDGVDLAKTLGLLRQNNNRVKVTFNYRRKSKIVKSQRMSSSDYELQQNVDAAGISKDYVLFKCSNCGALTVKYIGFRPKYYTSFHSKRFPLRHFKNRRGRGPTCQSNDKSTTKRVKKNARKKRAAAGNRTRKPRKSGRSG